MMAPVAPQGLGDIICKFGSGAACVISGGGDLIKGGVSSAAGSAFEGMVKSFLESSVKVLEVLSTFWMRVPNPRVANQMVNSENVGATGLAGPLAHVTESIAPFLALLSLGIIMVQCIIAVLKMSGEPLLSVGRQLLSIVVVQGCLAAVVQLGLQATDDFSRTVLDLPGISQGGLTGLLTVSGAMNSNVPALWLLLAILAILGSVMQLIFMMFRGPLIILLMIAAHAAAAAAGGRAGQQRLTRTMGLLTSFIIYKAVAAIIYAAGFMLIYGVDGDPGQKTSDTLMNTLYGFTIILLAAIALPAVIKFVDPIAGSTGSSLFSGAVAAGAIAGGAAMVATGGATAAGGGSSASGAGSAGGSAAAGGPTGGSAAGGDTPGATGGGGVVPSAGSDGPASSGGSTPSGISRAESGPGDKSGSGSSSADSSGKPGAGTDSAAGSTQTSSGTSSSEGIPRMPAWARAASSAGQAGRKTQEVTDEALAAEGTHS